MDLGIAGRRALVAASSRGLGFACARALAREGVDVVLNGRDAGRLDRAALLLRTECPDARVEAVVADIATRRGRDAVLVTAPAVDILVTNNAGPTPAPHASWTEDVLVSAVRANAASALELIVRYLPGMRERGFGRIVNITSAMVKRPEGDLGISAAARAALTASSKAISRDVARDGVTVNNLLPERFDTERAAEMMARRARADGIAVDEVRKRALDEIPAGRLGDPEEFGAACAFLCAATSGYITGQSIVLDGGSYGGLL